MGRAQNFNLTIANTGLFTYENVRRIRGKIMYHTSARFHAIKIITWILTETRRCKNIQKKVKLVEKLDFHIGQINKSDLEKEISTNEKTKLTFYNTCLYLYLYSM